jgi:D-alanine-D-alanine ligase-like ATP-grasp enzyme
MQALALDAYHTLGMADYGRIDTILSPTGPWLLEANTFAGLMFGAGGQPGSYLSFMAHAAGWTGPDLLEAIVQAAVSRVGIGG